jgi:hypothetical protein
MKLKSQAVRRSLSLFRYGPGIGVGKLRDETSIDVYTLFVTQLPDFRIGAFQATLYETTKSPLPLGYIGGVDVNALVDELRVLYGRVVESKEANELIAPAICDHDKPNEEGTKRGLANILYLRHLWFDFENGELRPDEIPKLFPHIRMVVTNSYRHTNEKSRFHVLIPVKQPLTPEANKALWMLFAYKLEDAGYQVFPLRNPSTRPASFLDLGKRPPSSLFYLPCQAQDPSQSFFIDYKEPPREILDAEVWISNSIIPGQPLLEAFPVIDGNRPIDEAKVYAATTEWQDSRNHPGEGGWRFWIYALKLRSAGMDLPEIKAKLTAEAKNGRTPKERLWQIKSIMDSLRKPRRRSG